MDEDNFRDHVAETLEAIRALLVRSLDVQTEDTEIEKGIRDLEKKRTETTTNLLEYTGVTNAKRTDRPCPRADTPIHEIHRAFRHSYGNVS